MNRIWRVISCIAAGLIVVGIVLIGAGLLTGASLHRITELVFGGQTELEDWFRSGVDRAVLFWTTLRDLAVQMVGKLF